TLPFFHVGTENFGVEFSEDNIRTSCIVSYWCNIPLMASSAARSPIEEGKNIMQFFSPGYIKKTIEGDLPSKKDFLILYNKELINDEEKSMLENSTKLFDNGKYELWALSYKNAFQNNSVEIISKYNSQKDSLLKDRDFSVTQMPDTLAYSGFDSLKSEFVYKGSGALQVKKSDFTVLFQSDGGLKENEDYTVSFWYYNKGELRNQVLCAVEECDKDGSNCRWDIIWDPRRSMVIDGDWSLLEKKFRIKDNTEKIRIFVQGDVKSNQLIYIDEFLLRPSGVDVYKLFPANQDTTLFRNNRWIN
ncbi:MAG: carbohydrate binding domain-containing protein, partial [Bacteroidota bacterium]